MNKLEHPSRIPAWASMLGEAGFKNFLALIEGYFAARDIVINVDEDEGVVRPTLSATLQSSVFGLQNIAQVCHQAQRAEWQQLIASHFDSIFNVSEDHNALTVDMSEFKKVQQRLRARLYPQDITNHTNEIVHRDGPAGTLEVLVLDLPTTVRTVSKQEAAGWPFTEDELLLIGRRNLRGNGLLQGKNVPLDQGTSLWLYSGDNFYAASHALIFDDYMAKHGDARNYGAIIGIPKRDVLLAHFIHNVGAVEAIGSMLQAVVGMHRDGPGSITPNLFWYHKGEFKPLPYILEGNTLNFAPPDEFVAVLNELSERANLS